ncbi:MAG TPA: flagellar hook-basal body complex protein FliE [Alphaproteobacteria bacterium]
MPIDKINPAAAASVYANSLKGGASGVTGGDGVSFGDLIRKATVDSIDTMHKGEKMSADAVIGKANLTDVVEAVTAAEMTLNTVVAMRDRMLGAYQEIMRMPI